MTGTTAARAAAGSLELARDRIRGSRCVVGFDGFIDSLYRVVSRRSAGGEPVYYSTIPEFAERVARSAGKSSDTEIVLQEVRAGGNGPILAGALAALGLNVSCIGGLGENGVEEPFRSLERQCRCFSLGAAGRTLALEFDDGKLMFGDDRGLAGLTWAHITSLVGRETLSGIIRESDLVAIVDWAYVRNMASIVECLCDQVLAGLPVPVLRGKRFLFDLADVSGRGSDEVRTMCRAMERAASHVDVTLGLNQNEAEVLARALSGGDPPADLASLATTLSGRLAVGSVVIHGHREAVAVRGAQMARAEGFYVEQPRLTTGGGDVFNAGLSLGLLAGAPLDQALAVGRAASALYVATGSSPTLARLIEVLGSEP